MSADEFIEQYGRIEMLKLMKAEGSSDADVLSNRGGSNRELSVGRGNVIGMG